MNETSPHLSETVLKMRKNGDGLALESREERAAHRLSMNHEEELAPSCPEPVPPAKAGRSAASSASPPHGPAAATPATSSRDPLARKRFF